MEHAILHEIIDGQTVEFYPETGLEDVINLDTGDTLKTILGTLATGADLNVERIARETAETALDGRITAIGGTITAHNVDTTAHADIRSACDLKAPLASPALTGVPTAPTAAAGTNNTQIATTAFATTAANVPISEHNTSATAHSDIRSAIGTQISSHNTDETAHQDLRQLIETASGVWQKLDGNAIIPKDLGDLTPSDLHTDEETIRGIVAELIEYIPVGVVYQWPSNESIPTGHLECNGASLLRSMYPALFAAIGTTWGAEDDDHFSLPDYRGRFAEGADESGEIKDAGLPNITGSISLDAQYDSSVKSASGALNSYNRSTGRHNNADYASADTIVTFNASDSNAIYGNSSTVQPPALTVRYIIKAFDTQGDASALIDVTTYANELAHLSATRMNLESDFTIIYPNGGSEAAPANVAANSRYVMSNPFPGYDIHCVAEVKYNNVWSNAGFAQTLDYGNWLSYGVMANSTDDDVVVIQTGINYVFLGSSLTGSALGGGTSTTAASLPCRVKVWKIGKQVSE